MAVGDVGEGRRRPPRELCGVWEPPFPHGQCDLREDVATRLVYERVRQLVVAAERRRAELGWSWTQVAELSGVAPSTLRNVRTGVSWPDIHTFVQLSDALGIDRLLPKPADDQVGRPFAATAAIGNVDREVVEALGMRGPVGVDAALEALLEVAVRLAAGPAVEGCHTCHLLEGLGACHVCDDNSDVTGVQVWEAVDVRIGQRVADRVAHARRHQQRVDQLHRLWQRLARERAVLTVDSGETPP